MNLKMDKEFFFCWLSLMQSARRIFLLSEFSYNLTLFLLSEFSYNLKLPILMLHSIQILLETAVLK